MIIEGLDIVCVNSDPRKFAGYVETMSSSSSSSRRRRRRRRVATCLTACLTDNNLIPYSDGQLAVVHDTHTRRRSAIALLLV